MVPGAQGLSVGVAGGDLDRRVQAALLTALVLLTWLGALVHVVLSWRGRQRATVARVLLDVTAVLIVLLLAVPIVVAALALLRG